MPVSQIVQRQIVDGAINDAKVAAGAAIATTKLADGANLILRTGAVAFTGNQSLGNNKITGLATGTNNDEAVNVGQLNSAIAAQVNLFDFKGSTRVATTGNITNLLTGAPNSVDGITVVVGNRILVKSQTTTSGNGIYTVTTVGTGANGVWARALDMDAWDEVPGAMTVVEEGTAHADTVWLCTSNQGGTIGTTAIVWYAMPMTAGTGGLQESNFVDNETPSGTVNGSNVTFTLANAPSPAASLQLFVNGLLQESGSGNDYTLSSATITFLTGAIPVTGDKIRGYYRKA
jgi:hypothetical protein